MSHTIRVQPAARLRRDFAVWATSQNPKVGTVAPNTFAVPHSLYGDVPEALLIGALVNGQRYAPAAEADEVEEPFTPPVLEFMTAVPGEALPELPASAYGPDSVPLEPPVFAPLDDAPEDDEEHQDQGGTPGDSDPSDPDADMAQHTCSDCGRPFQTAHGLTVHRRMMHAEES